MSCHIAHNGKSLISIFQEFSSSIDKTFILGGGAGHWAIILCSLDSLLIFPNFLRSEVLSRSTTREATRI